MGAQDCERDVSSQPITDVAHVTEVCMDSDLRGAVCYARCMCGWRGPNHPAAVIALDEARRRATADLRAHLGSAPTT